MKKNIFKIIVTAAVLLSVICSHVSVLAEQTAVSGAAGNSGNNGSKNIISYNNYINGVPSKNASSDIKINIQNYLTDDGMQAQTLQEYIDCFGTFVKTDSQGSITFPFTVSEAGLYNLSVTYSSVLDEEAIILRDIMIDGEYPFYEAIELEFERSWRNGEYTVPEFADQIQPPQEEFLRFATKKVMDSSGYYPRPLCFYLSAGNHTLTFVSRRDTLVIKDLSFTSPKDIPSYNEYLKIHNGGNAVKSSKKIQAEDASAKSDQTLVPLCERSSVKIEPYSTNYKRYNEIGGERWSKVGQWVEWEIDAPEDGFYNIAARWSQTVKYNEISYRSLTIDGEVPFAEASEIEFPNSSWKVSALGNDSPYKFYFKKGVHTVRLLVTLGKTSDIINQIDASISELNRIYRRIVTITGPDPDLYRDYQFEKVMPDVIKDIKSEASHLKKTEKQLIKLAGAESSSTATIRSIYIQLDKMASKPSLIASMLSSYKNNISSLGTWIKNEREQPLELDWLWLVPPNSKLPKSEAGFFPMLWHYIKQFLFTFSNDYKNSSSGPSDAAITVWVSDGQDQTNIRKRLAKDGFTKQSGINVKYELVAATSLLPATLAGIGPDVVHLLGEANLMNYAFRNAVYDLSEFDDCNSILKRFEKSAVSPLSFNGGVYGLPETQSYPMLFYRTDILEELNISTDHLGTWDDIFKYVLPKIQRSYLYFGLPTDSFNMFLYQEGGSLYNKGFTKCTVNSSEGVKAFTRFTQVYCEYKQPLSYSFENRFRSGEMPIAIADFMTYNQLILFAPEIKGLWSMAPVPATVRDDGTKDNSAISVGVASAIMNKSDKKADAWEYLKWWSSENNQTAYARELESTIGPAARYATANIEAKKSIQWDGDIKSALEEQAKSLVAIPNVPGSYFTARYMSFAFRDIVYNGADVREVLNDSVVSINSEITKKRAEFGLD